MHVVYIFPVADTHYKDLRGPGWLQIAQLPPLRMLWSGSEAVLFFFVLSGFVLAQPYFTDTRPSAPVFIARRMARIYPPFAAAVVGAVILRLTLDPTVTPPLSHTYLSQWAAPLTPSIVASHLFLMAGFNIFALDGPMWSLIHEMRVSLILPWLARIVRRLSNRSVLALLLAGYVIGSLPNAHTALNKTQAPLTSFLLRGLAIAQYQTSTSLRYLVLFVIGILLAKNLPSLTAKYASRSGRDRTIVVSLAVVIYSIAHMVMWKWGLFGNLCFELLVGFASCTFIVAVVATRPKALRSRWLVSLGHMSYSLYLWHVLVILAATRLFLPILPMGWVIAIIGALCLLVPAGFYFAVERPSIRWSRGIRSPEPKPVGSSARPYRICMHAIDEHRRRTADRHERHTTGHPLDSQSHVAGRLLATQRPWRRGRRVTPSLFSRAESLRRQPRAEQPMRAHLYRALGYATALAARFRVGRRFPISRRLYFRANAILAPTVVTVGDWTVYFHRRDTAISHALRTDRAYEAYEIELIGRLLRSGDYALDVGANIGLHTLAMAAACGPTGRVIALEPDPSNVRLWKKNVLVNNVHNAELRPVAASDISGRARLYLNGSNLGDHRLYDHDRAEHSIPVVTRTVDEIWQGLERNPAIVKVDVQGWEPHVLAGASQLLNSAAPLAVMTELWSDGISRAGSTVDSYVRMLVDLELELFEIDESTQVLHPFALDHSRARSSLETNLVGVRGAMRERLFSAD